MKKVAVIGLGNIASRHRHNLKLLFPNVELLVMSASGRIPKEEISDSDGIVKGIEELIQAQVELVIVASPAPFHAQHSIPFIEAGIPTLIEKPITTTVDDAKAIQLAMELHNTPVCIGYCLRYLPSAQTIKAFFDGGGIGTLYNAHIEIGQYLPDWRPSKNYLDCVSANKMLGGGALFELSHELDFTQWLLGPLSFQHGILRKSADLALEVEDLVDIMFLTESGSVTNIHLDFLQPKAYRQCSFTGSEGRVDWDLLQNKITLTTATEVKTLHNEPSWDKNKMYLAMITDFIEMIEGKPNNCIKVREASATVNLINIVKNHSSKQEK